MAAPIMISSDVRNMSNETKELYLNKDMIAINQDSLGVQGHRISDKQGKQVWTKPLKNGDIAVALLNNNSSTQTVECNFADLGVEGEVEVRDAWKKKDLGALSHVSVELPAHGSALLRLVVKPVPRGLFKGEAFAIPGKIEMEDFDVNGVGQGNTTYNESDTENHGDSDYRPGTGVDLYEKATGVIVGYNQAGEWLEYTVKVKEAGDYTMVASVATDNSTASFTLSIDGKSVAEVPVSGESWDDFTDVKAKVTLPAGEHILRFEVTGDWFDIDYIQFCAGESCDGSDILPISKDLNFARSTTESFKVFGMTGKFLGRLEMNGSAADMPAALKAAGYARGVYMVRGSGATQRIHVK
jgi:alpha-galactosidase